MEQRGKFQQRVLRNFWVVSIKIVYKFKPCNECNFAMDYKPDFMSKQFVLDNKFPK